MMKQQVSRKLLLFALVLVHTNLIGAIDNTGRREEQQGGDDTIAQQQSRDDAMAQQMRDFHLQDAEMEEEKKVAEVAAELVTAAQGEEDHQEAPSDDDPDQGQYYVSPMPEEELPPYKDVLEFEFDGKQIRVPYYDINVKRITVARQEFEMRAMEKSRVVSNETAYAAIYHNKVVGLFPYLLKAAKLIAVTRCDYLDLDVESVEPPLTLEFNHRVHAAWANALRKGNEAWKKEQEDLKRLGKQRPEKATKEEIKEFIDRIDKFYQIVIEVIKRGPVGIYMDWFELHIDNQKIEDYASPYVTFLRRNSYNAILSAADRMATMLKDIDWQSTKTPKLLGIPLNLVQNFFDCIYRDDKGEVVRKVNMNRLAREKEKEREKERQVQAANTIDTMPTKAAASCKGSSKYGLAKTAADSKAKTDFCTGTGNAKAKGRKSKTSTKVVCDDDGNVSISASSSAKTVSSSWC